MVNDLDLDMEPHNIEAEQALLGSILIEPEMFNVVSFLKAEDFHDQRHAWIFEAIQKLSQDGTGIDLVTVMDNLDRRIYIGELEAAYLTELVGKAETRYTHAEHYAKIIEADSLRRQAITRMAAMVKLCYEKVVSLQTVSEHLQELSLEVLPRSERTYRPLGEILGEIMDRQEKISQEGAPPGLSTGLADLDAMLGGLQESDVVVLAGRPGMGKTALATDIMVNVAKGGHPVGLFTLEMSSEQMGGRTISRESGYLDRHITVNQIRRGTIYEDGLISEFIQSIDNLHKLPIFIDDTPSINPSDLFARAKRMQTEQGVELLVIDYLQLMESGLKRASTVEQVTHISKMVKRIAKALKLPVILLSQLSRQVESRHDKRPVPSDLRDSGAIEQDSDAILFLYRDEVYDKDSEYKGFAEAILAKYRHGPTGMRYLQFNKSTASFSDGHELVRKVILETNDY